MKIQNYKSRVHKKKTKKKNIYSVTHNIWVKNIYLKGNHFKYLFKKNLIILNVVKEARIKFTLDTAATLYHEEKKKLSEKGGMAEDQLSVRGCRRFGREQKIRFIRPLLPPLLPPRSVGYV